MTIGDLVERAREWLRDGVEGDRRRAPRRAGGGRGRGRGASGTPAALGHGARILGAMEPLPSPDSYRRAGGLRRRRRARRPDPLPRLGRPADRRAEARAPGVLLIHGLSKTAWSWTPVARRLARRPATSSRWTCAVTACPTHRPRATTRRRSPSRRAWPRPRARACWRAGRPRRPRRSRVRGDRRGLGRGGPGRSLRRARARRWRLGVARGRHGHRCRRVPARPRRAAGGPALDDARSWPIARRSTRPTWDADQERAARATVVETHAARSCRRRGRTRSRPACGRCSRTTRSRP